VTTLHDIASVLATADPKLKAEVYAELGVRVAYDHERRVVKVEARPANACAKGRVGEPTSPFSDWRLQPWGAQAETGQGTNVHPALNIEEIESRTISWPLQTSTDCPSRGDSKQQYSKRYGDLQNADDSIIEKQPKQDGE
jgi:hypothetical protein